MSRINDIYGTMVFNDAVMKARLPEETYTQLRRSMDEGSRLSQEDAEIIASAMKDWAIEKGVTHFTHWFQPMTNITAEKHDSFLVPDGNGGVIMEFSGSELIHGEPDASSFPSGGLRATFEARGYTAWDPTSYAFIKDGVLCIPTAFCAYGGQALDKKIPLLRSMQALNRQGLRLMKLLGRNDIRSIKVNVGAEQEYFLIDDEMYSKRKDLLYTGRTLFGAKPPKGQELDDHYSGAIKPRVQEFMTELDEELWKLGVLAKTEHNEAAPAQHEIAPYFTSVNIAADHNQIIMELMQRIARKHHLVCLLHEKPFAGVNGSGKHNNWSISTDSGLNLLEPGETPQENAQFLLVLCAVLQAVDNYQDLLRMSVSSAGNDLRLGGNEAPPAVISVFLGDQLTEILKAIENDESYAPGEKEIFKVGVHVLPKFPKDSTDRNRTSPFAFTGNKFEFRMPGSSASISGCNVVLNTAVAESFSQFSDYLEASEKPVQEAIRDLIKKCISEHSKIIFNGNGYGKEWQKEAGARGLLNLPSLADCAPCYLDPKNADLFSRHRIYTPEELNARYLIKLESYCKVIRIEALTMLDMVWKDIFPAASSYSTFLTESAYKKNNAGFEVDSSFEQAVASGISKILSAAFSIAGVLEKNLKEAEKITDPLKAACHYRDYVLSAMNDLRTEADELENCVSAEYWPYPSYGDILFSVN